MHCLIHIDIGHCISHRKGRENSNLPFHHHHRTHQIYCQRGYELCTSSSFRTLCERYVETVVI